MRIGTSVVAGDNDIEVFATTTLLEVASVSDITVFDGDAVPTTVLTPNVPGATIDWSRTPETIGLVPTSGTGNVPAFTAFNASGIPVTSTFTVNATLGNCESQDMVFTITVNPDPCTITVDFFGNPGPCNDNGTPNDPSDDFFTQNIHASFFNRPSTGSLQIVPGGDQIGVYSIPVNQIVGNAHTFNAVMLKADGTPSIVQMNFTDDPGCIDADSGPTVQPCSTPPPPCTITVDFFGNPGPCNDNGTPNDPNDDFFTQNIHASFFNRPGTGSLQIVPGGDQIGVYSIPVNQIIGNAHLFTAVMLKADGTPSIVQMNFTDDPGCIDSDTGPTVQPCSNNASCEIIGFSFNNIGQCNDNGTPGNDNDDFFTVDVDVLFSNSLGGNTQLRLNGADVIDPRSISAPIGTNLTHTFVGVMLRADGQITDLEADIFNANPICSGLGTGPSVNSCSNGGSVCAITDLELVNLEPCDDNGTPNDPTDDFYIADINVFFENPPSTGLLEFTGDDFVDGDFAFAIANVLSIGSPFGVSNKKFRADGQSTSFVVEFTGASGCIAGMSTPVGVEPCSFPPPVLTCPPHATVSCFNNVPLADPSDVLETHECPGNVDIVLQLEVNQGQTCPNKLTVVRIYQATDACGQTASCSQFITVDDQTDPTMTCPGNVTVSCASNVPPADIATVTNVGDNCGGTVSIFPQGDNISNQTCPNRFTILRTYFAVDVCNNSNNCIQTITVHDQTKPTMTCPINVTVSCANQVPAANTASVTGVGDNCGGTVTITNFPSDAISNQTCANRFTITRSYFAVDVCGNSNNCTQIITVNDQTSPTITCPAPQTFSCAEQVPAPNPALVTGSDNCGGAIIPSFFSNTISNQTCTNRFTLTRQYRAADLCGNTSSCIQVINVNDQTPPVFTFVPANVTVDCYQIPVVGIATASDNCTSGATVAFLGEVEVQDICPVWKILTRTWRATDACGNSATASQVITVTDFNAPQFLVLPKNQIVECGPNNAAAFQAFLDNRGGAVVQDCAQITYTHEDSPFQNNYFDCGNTFHKNIRFFATDECGNVSYRDASFTVVDQTPPVFSTPPQSVNLECDASDDNGENAFYDWLESNAGLVAEDNCGEVELEKIQVSEYTGCGNTWRKTYEFRAKDECGNLTKTTATFAVVDNTPPTLECPPNDNIFLACIEDVPAADPSALSASDCSGVTLSLIDTWTNGTGCPGWMMTVAYRYAATDGCGNQAICERAFYVEETNAPTLICPDTIKLICANDIPGPAQLFGYIKSLLVGDCAGGFNSVAILNDSGQPQNGTTHRTYTFTAKNHCGKVSSSCSVTFLATGTCNQLCTASQASWGDPGGTVGGMLASDVLQSLLSEYGPVTVGGGNHTVSAPNASCVQEMLFGSGNLGFLPTGQFSCPLPGSLANPDGSLNNQLAANALALQLNIWYNLEFNNRDLGGQDLHNLPPCLVEFAVLKDLGQKSTVQDLLNLTNQYLQGFVGNYPVDMPAMLNAALDNLNHFRVDCGLNAPCERPGQGRSDQKTTLIRNFNLAPNPATDAVTISLESEKEGEVQLQIFDGRILLLERNIQVVSALNSVEISLKNLPAGMYYVLVKDAEGVKTRQLVKVE